MEALAETLTPGTPVYSRDRRGFVAAIAANESRSFTLGTGTMRPVRANLTVVWENGGIAADIPDTMAEDWAAEARRIGLAFVADHAERYAAALAKQAAARQAAADEREAANKAAAEFAADAVAKIPNDAKAVIIAEFRRDDSDTMTDYFASHTERTVILAFSSHTRDLFPELRKAALNHPETAHLADLPASAEHREKYSMGAGYYLSASSYQHNTGWRVRKRSIGGDTPEARAKSIPFGEWSLPAAAPAPVEADAVPVGGFTIEKHTHTKRGFDMWLCILPGRVDRAEFDRLRDAAEALGGWYSKPWGKTPGGFAFKAEADAQAFANAEPSNPPPDGPRGPIMANGREIVRDANGFGVPGPARPGMGDKLRAIADGMQRDIDHKLGDRLTNTPKRQREAGNARNDGRWLQRTQKGLRALADLHDAGTVPAALAKVTTKAAAHGLARSVVEHNGGYYDAGRDTGRPALDTPEAVAFWELIGGGPSEAERQAEELRRKIEALQFANIPGYFPTPAAVVADMIEAADIPESEAATILEPEAGSGSIADAIRSAYPAAALHVFEVHETLKAILRAKGHHFAGNDFLAMRWNPVWDRILMNPPFENGQDIEHVRHAFDCLKPGGRLVAIMSPGTFFRQGRKESDFRAWFDELGGERRDLPAGAFKESGTGVATVMVVLDKPEGEPEPPQEVKRAGGYVFYRDSSGHYGCSREGEAPPSHCGYASVEAIAQFKGVSLALTEPPRSPIGTRWGTSHFASIAAARRYYAGQNFDAAAVLDKLEAGEIHIGPPDAKPGERVTLNPEGRYVVEVVE